MPLDRLTQITASGISSTSPLTGINITGVITATSITATNYGSVNATPINASGVSTFQASSYWGDGDVAYFGDGQDLLIFHNSTDSIIRDNGTGDLYLQGGNKIRMTNPTGTESYAIFNQDGATELYHDNSKKFETSGIGVTVTGRLDADTINITGVTTFSGGPVIIGSATSTGTASQRLQITGGAYVSDYVAIGITVRSNVKTILQGVGTTNALYDPSSTTAGGVLVYVRNNDTTAGTDATIRLDANGSSTTAATTISAISESTGGNSALAFGTRSGGGNVTEKLRITSSGNVGVGSTIPSAKIDVIDSAANPSVAPVAFIQRTNNIVPASIAPTNAELRIKGHSSNYKIYVEDQNANPLLAVRGNGNIGIGTTNPDEEVHIHSASNPFIKFTSNVNSNSVYFGYNTSIDGADIQASGVTRFYNNGAERVRIDSSGNVTPGADNTYNLGASGTRWSNIYGRRVIGNGYGSLGDYGGLFGQIRVGADTFGNTIKVVNDTNLNITANNSIYFNTGAATDGSTTGTTRAQIDSSGNFQFNSGYGSVATAYGCRAWVNFNGTGTVAIRASGNVSSITDNGTGNYTVNFTTALPDANYSVAGMVKGNSASTDSYISMGGTGQTNPSSSACFVLTFQASTATDQPYVCCSFFR